VEITIAYTGRLKNAIVVTPITDELLGCEGNSLVVEEKEPSSSSLGLQTLDISWNI
jgi:hypothetical protein